MAWQEKCCGHSVASFWGVPLPQRSSSGCWWDPNGKSEQRTQRCPFVLWSTTFPCSDLEASTWSRRSWNVQARAWPAGCEIATKKSKVLSNSVFVRTQLQARLQPLGVQATRTERNLGIDFASGRRASCHSGAAGAAGQVQRACQAHQEKSMANRRCRPLACRGWSGVSFACNGW